MPQDNSLKARASGLFWRTFGLLIILVTTSVGAWLYGLSLLDDEPRAQGIAQRITSITTLTRYALISSDTSYRFDLIMTLAEQEGLFILPKEKSDIYKPVPSNRLFELVTEFVRQQLGQNTQLAARVNGVNGLWVSFSIDGDEYWLRTERDINPSRLGTNWIFWFAVMLLFCTFFTVLLTGRIIEPLARLTLFAKQLGQGKTPKPLPIEGPKEIQQVNESFNLMVSDLKTLANDREVLLAGVSHDLRTPITRLRLEVELAPISESTREAMCDDLDQMESIVKQFMSYVREREQPLEVVDISQTVESAIGMSRFKQSPDIHLTTDIEQGMRVRANPTELIRAVQNLLVNASKYGRSTDGQLRLTVTLKHNKRRNVAELTVSDDGAGLPEDQFERVLRPFERGEKARSNTTGTGLGLSIVDRVAKAGGGSVRLSQNIPNGLSIHMTMPIIPESSLLVMNKNAG